MPFPGMLDASSEADTRPEGGGLLSRVADWLTGLVMLSFWSWCHIHCFTACRMFESMEWIVLIGIPLLQLRTMKDFDTKGELWIVCCEFWAVSYERWVVSYERWAVNCVLWVLGCELWAVGCGLWAVSCELWAVSCQVSGASCQMWVVGGVSYERWVVSYERWAVAPHCSKDSVVCSSVPKNELSGTQRAFRKSVAHFHPPRQKRMPPTAKKERKLKTID